MGLDIYGWVEIYDAEFDQWSGILQATYLMSRSYRVFAILFGKTRHDEDGFTPVASFRGLPENISSEVKEYTDDGGFGHSHSWVTWEELKNVDWSQYEHYVDDFPQGTYLLLFQMMQLLASQWGDKNVRLVVWFDMPLEHYI